MKTGRKLEYLIPASSHRQRPKHRYTTPIISMPKNEMPSGSVALLILRVSGMARYRLAIAQRIHVLSSEVLTWKKDRCIRHSRRCC